jgi:hypothetical protein
MDSGQMLAMSVDKEQAIPAAIKRTLEGLLVQKKPAPEREEKRVRKSEMETLRYTIEVIWP